MEESLEYQIKIKSGAKKDLKKIKGSRFEKSFLEIIETLRNNPFEISQSFEKLIPPINRFYSRRINFQRRVVYKVDKKLRIVTIYSAYSHYE
ncbi:Txe/YoeB family addiction module toxin [Companilactobacillus nodensis]|uniref:Txe/YoeB family addiction module toxin n=1 Tax=Companilactobacillus nodensis TaxID=460870 RepID=UPI00046A93C6|nr:Txe/YoeB family addiction module toxin [Companilactobacillus nodensis]